MDMLHGGGINRSRDCVGIALYAAERRKVRVGRVGV